MTDDDEHRWDESDLPTPVARQTWHAHCSELLHHLLAGSLLLARSHGPYLALALRLFL